MRVMRVDAGRVVEIVDMPDRIGDRDARVSDHFHAAAGFVIAPVGVDVGMVRVDGAWAAPPPPPPAVPPIISRRQFYQGLAKAGFISIFDAIGSGAVVPPALRAVIDGIDDAGSRFDAEMILLYATEFHRAHPLVEAFGLSAAKPGGGAMTPGDIDDFWRFCAAL